DLFRERAHIGREQCDPLRAERLEPRDECAGTREDLGLGPALSELLPDRELDVAVLAGTTRHDRHEAGVQDDIDTRVAELEDAPLALGVHCRQALGRDRVHAHAARMEGEIRAGVAREELRQLRLDSDVRTRYDQSDALGTRHMCGAPSCALLPLFYITVDNQTPTSTLWVELCPARVSA